MNRRLGFAVFLSAWLLPTLLTAAPPPRKRAPAPKRPVPYRWTPPRRWVPPVVIPANYIVRPALEDLPELVSPLDNLTLAELSDSFAYRRYDGAVHWGIDIFRPAGTELRAVVDGRVRLVDNPLGGLSVYLTDTLNEFRFYYAHLDGYPPGLRDGAMVRQGEVVGYVGNTGNARYTKSHLHFEVHVLAAWMLDETGEVSSKAGVLNPCPILRGVVAQQAAIAAGQE